MSAKDFVGVWVSDTMENFDEYMKALGLNIFLRKAGTVAKTTIHFSQDGDVWTWAYKIAFKSGEFKFKFGEEYDEVTPDGRHVKNTWTFENGALVQVQRGPPAENTLTRTIEGGRMVEINKIKDVVCRRTYIRKE